MTDVYLIAILVVSFTFVIGLIQAISRMLERDPLTGAAPGHAHPHGTRRGSR